MTPITKRNDLRDIRATVPKVTNELEQIVKPQVAGVGIGDSEGAGKKDKKTMQGVLSGYLAIRCPGMDRNRQLKEPLITAFVSPSKISTTERHFKVRIRQDGMTK